MNVPSNRVEAGRRLAAGVLVAALGAAIVIAAVPLLMGLLGAPLLAVLFAPIYNRLTRRISPRWAAILVLALAVVAVLLPASLVVALVVREAPDALSGPGAQQLIATVSGLEVQGFAVGEEVAKASRDIVAWLSREVVLFAGGVTRLAINLLIAFLGFYYLLLSGDGAWETAAQYVPFSRATLERLRERFTSITRAMVAGIVVTAIAQGAVVGGAFAILDLEHALLWGVMTGVASVLPVLGSALVWLPGVAVLFIEHRTGAAIVLAAIGLIVASNIDNLIRPVVYSRVSGLHPLLTVVGAFMGLQYFGLLGVLVGPLALAYFFELARAFRQEYVDPPVITA
jgi:predicted PurR-regulated permease PerM